MHVNVDTCLLDNNEYESYIYRYCFWKDTYADLPWFHIFCLQEDGGRYLEDEDEVLDRIEVGIYLYLYPMTVTGRQESI